MKSFLARFTLLVCLFSFQLVTNSSAWAQASCQTQLTKPEALRDSAVELEMLIDEKSVAMLTTLDGSLRSLFKDESLIPSEVSSYILTNSPSQNLLAYPFSNLPTAIKIKALQQGIVSKKLTFQESAGGRRRIPGIQVKKEFQEEFNLMPHVEMGSFATADDGKLIEVHMRAPKLPGNLATQGAEFQKRLGYKPGSMHLHVLFQSMPEWLHKNPLQNTWRVIEYWRRLNLTMEMRDVVENGLALINNTTLYKGQGWMNFAPLQRNELQSAFSYFLKVAKKNVKSTDVLKSVKLESAAKMGWVGLWGHDKYDDANLFGFEFRFLQGTDLPPQLVGFLNQVQAQVENRDFGLSEEQFSHWSEVAQHRAEKNNLAYSFRSLVGDVRDFPKSFDYAYYRFLNPHRDYADLFNDAPEAVKPILLGMNQQKLAQSFNSRGRLRFLLHNWSMDPLLFDKFELQMKIENAQIKAIRKWGQGVNETQVIQEFLIESNLYQIFADSISLKT